MKIKLNEMVIKLWAEPQSDAQTKLSYAHQILSKSTRAVKSADALPASRQAGAHHRKTVFYPAQQRTSIKQKDQNFTIWIAEVGYESITYTLKGRDKIFFTKLMDFLGF